MSLYEVHIRCCTAAIGLYSARMLFKYRLKFPGDELLLNGLATAAAAVMPRG